MEGLIDKKVCRENERLVGEDEAEYVRSCRRQLLASFLGKNSKIVLMEYPDH